VHTPTGEDAHATGKPVGSKKRKAERSLPGQRKKITTRG
jgi:hypothetical protein